MQTNADIARRIPNVCFMIRRGAGGLEYVAVEKEDGRNVAFEYVAVEKEIQKHPHQGSLGGRERTRREGESRRQVEKEIEKEYVAVGKEIKKEYVAVEKHSMHSASRQKQHLENLMPTRSPPTPRASQPNLRPRPDPPRPRRGR